MVVVVVVVVALAFPVYLRRVNFSSFLFVFPAPSFFCCSFSLPLYPTLQNLDFDGWLVDWLFGFYGLSTYVGYLMPNLFLYK